MRHDWRSTKYLAQQPTRINKTLSSLQTIFTATILRTSRCTFTRTLLRLRAFIPSIYFDQVLVVGFGSCWQNMYLKVVFLFYSLLVCATLGVA
ncbi:hypothetical protein EV426DRAFT_614622 [Tirmania nivea]|nr:hypothetical protein EV426DRAFT_614622 [Tirmania nivea]